MLVLQAYIYKRQFALISFLLHLICWLHKFNHKKHCLKIRTQSRFNVYRCTCWLTFFICKFSLEQIISIYQLKKIIHERFIFFCFLINHVNFCTASWLIYIFCKLHFGQKPTISFNFSNYKDLLFQEQKLFYLLLSALWTITVSGIAF